MTNLDIMARALHKAAGLPVAHWRKVIRCAVATTGADIRRDTNLLEEVPDAEAKRTIAQLTTPAEQAAIIGWLLQGAAAAPLFPESMRRFDAYMNGEQN